MAEISLNGRLLRDLIAIRFKRGVSDLIEAWEASESPAGKTVPHRATVYRWQQGQIPRREELLRLCALLDVDPFSLLALPEADEADAIRRLHSSFWLDRWDPSALSFLAEFFGHQTDWPPTLMAKTYYGRAWFTKEIEHDANHRVNYYAQIEVTSAQDHRREIPQVFHFAYQQPGAFGHRWIQYGFVERLRTSVRLVNIKGEMERYAARAMNDPTLVETWFGPSFTNFRIASLHDFSITLRSSEVDTAERVRFSA